MDAITQFLLVEARFQVLDVFWLRRFELINDERLLESRKLKNNCFDEILFKQKNFKSILKVQLMKVKRLLTILTLCSFFSCKKDEKEDICTVAMASIANTYKLVGMKYKANATAPEQDFGAMRETCEKDDVIVFLANGTFEYKDINLQCSPSGNYTSSWSLNGNNIVIDGDQGTVQSYDCNTLVITGNDFIIAGDMITYTFEKQ